MPFRGRGRAFPRYHGRNHGEGAARKTDREEATMTATKFLLTSDLSEESLRAFEPVGRLCAQVQGRVTLLRVVVDQGPVAVAPMAAPAPVMTDVDGIVSASQAQLARLRERLPADLPVEIDVVVGSSEAEKIAEYAQRNGFDYIAMATHGRSGLRRMMLGSTAEDVLRRSTVPLLLFPPPA